MFRLPKRLTVLSFWMLVFLTSYSFTQTGEPPQYTEGSFLVKFYEGVVLNKSYTPEGYLQVGIQEIDSLNMIYQVRDMASVFTGPVISTELYNGIFLRQIIVMT